MTDWRQERKIIDRQSPIMRSAMVVTLVSGRALPTARLAAAAANKAPTPTLTRGPVSWGRIQTASHEMRVYLYLCWSLPAFTFAAIATLLIYSAV